MAVFLNYGIAGIILFVFYKLMSVEIRGLRKAIENLEKMTNALKESIEKHNMLLDFLIRRYNDGDKGHRKEG